MKRATQPKTPAKARVGLDKPCRQCGQPIYFNYRGPIEGLCGRCTDRARSEKRRWRPRRGARPAGARSVSVRALRGALVLMAFLAAAAAALLVHRWIS